VQKIVIFDMDGTLINSAQDITISINHVRSHLYSLPPLQEQFVVDAINAHERNLALLFYERDLYEYSAKEMFEELYYHQCICNVHPYEDISETLRLLHENGCRMSVATNAPSTFAKRMLSHLNLIDYFSSILGADNVAQPKPHPEMIEQLLEHHRYNPSHDRAWMIGDNSKDMEAASRAGIIGVFAGWGFSSEGNGDYFAASPESLYDIICSKG
jgi:phosphoglycolate phosphatase